MGKRINKLKKIRIHREGTQELILSAIVLAGIAWLLLHFFDSVIPFWIFIIIFGTVWFIALNFYRCPIRWWLLPTAASWSSRKWKSMSISTTSD